MEFADGSLYTGDFKENYFHGVGTHRWSNGKVYEGQWVKNEMHGKGRIKWPDGRSYEGEYDKGNSSTHLFPNQMFYYLNNQNYNFYSEKQSKLDALGVAGFPNNSGFGFNLHFRFEKGRQRKVHLA